MSGIVSIENLRKRFGNHEVLRGISLEIQKGDLVCLIGRSGCGKSTLLRCLNGLEILDEGSVTVVDQKLEHKKGEKIDPAEFEKKAQALRKNCGMVFQDFRLFPHLSLLDNIVCAQTIVKNTPKDEAIEKARQLLSKVGLAAHEKKLPSQLSGGQSQRGAIARALALNPLVMLYDEPTSALDPELVDEVLQTMKQLDQDGMTQIAVTHEMRFARDASDYVVYMEEGLIVESGPSDQIFSAPKDERTKQFLRKFL